jgi:hypothetical protein
MFRPISRAYLELPESSNELSTGLVVEGLGLVQAQTAKGLKAPAFFLRRFLTFRPSTLFSLLSSPLFEGLPLVFPSGFFTQAFLGKGASAIQSAANWNEDTLLRESRMR